MTDSTHASDAANEEKVERIYFSALRQVMPMLRPKNIEVKTKYPEGGELEYMKQSIARAGELTGERGSAGVQLDINVVGHDIDNEALRTLREITADMTGTIVSYHDNGINFKGSAGALVKLLDGPDFNRKVAAGIEPSGPAIS